VTPRNEPHCPLNRWLNADQSLSRCFGEEKHILPHWELPVISSVIQSGQCSWYSNCTVLTGWSGDHINMGRRFLSSPETSRQTPGPTQPPTLGYWGSFLGVKRPRCEADDSSPASAEVKNEWSSSSTYPLPPRIK